jgi:hypothetical protein
VEPQAVRDRNAAGAKIPSDWRPRRRLRVFPDPEGYFLLTLLISLTFCILLLRSSSRDGFRPAPTPETPAPQRRDQHRLGAADQKFPACVPH